MVVLFSRMGCTPALGQQVQLQDANVAALFKPADTAARHLKKFQSLFSRFFLKKELLSQQSQPIEQASSFSDQNFFLSERIAEQVTLRLEMDTKHFFRYPEVRFGNCRASCTGLSWGL